MVAKSNSFFQKRIFDLDNLKYASTTTCYKFLRELQPVPLRELLRSISSDPLANHLIRDNYLFPS